MDIFVVTNLACISHPELTRNSSGVQPVHVLHAIRVSSADSQPPAVRPDCRPLRRLCASQSGDPAQAITDDFLRFCTLNPKACPLLGVGEPGQWHVPALGADLDVRNDVPAFYVYRHSERVEEVRSLDALWRCRKPKDVS
jgi:hypothetical protein